jgi:hypothetical protein
MQLLLALVEAMAMVKMEEAVVVRVVVPGTAMPNLKLLYSIPG